MLRAVLAGMQREAFFSCWTRKELYLKARGIGLSLPLNQFDVTAVPGISAAILSIRGEGQDIYCWSLYDLSHGPSYGATLAVEGHSGYVKRWQ